MALPSPLKNLGGHVAWLYPAGVVVLAFAIGGVFGLGVGLLVFAGGVLGGSIWLIWSSLQGLGGELPLTLDEALSLGAPSAEEEQKRAVLRALKDLEYERAVGKINDEDYAKLAEHYRTEAKRLLRIVDRDLSPERERAERLLEERLAEVRSGAPGKGKTAEAKAGEGKAGEGSAGEDEDEASAEPSVERSGKPESDETDASAAAKRTPSETV